MRRTLPALALLLALASAASAETPKASVRGPARVAAEATIVLDARGSVADRPLRWKLDGPDVPFLTLDQEGRKGVVAIVPAAPAGTYRFTLIARGIPSGETELDADAAVWTVRVGEAPAPPAPPGPGPGPGPGPTPPPNPPAPVSGTLHVMLVVDLDAMTPDLATLRAGTRAREALKGLDAIYRTASVASPELDRIGLRPSAAKAGVPALVVQDAAGHVLVAERAPASEDQLIARIRSIREGK